MNASERVVRDFIAAWSSLDVDRLVNAFTEDGVYHNMPIQPVSGREALRPFIAAFLKGWESTEWEVLNLAAAGDMVIVERMDRTVVRGRRVDLPCCGVFHVRDGKIALWRDYFDMATYTRALAAPT